MSWSSSEIQYASTGGDGVKVWKFAGSSSLSEDNSHHCAFHFHKHCVVDAVQWNHNSTALICGSRDSILSIYQFHPFGIAFTLPSASISSSNSSDGSISSGLSISSISSLARSDGSRYLFSGTVGGVICCWDAQSKQITKKYVPSHSAQLSNTTKSTSASSSSSISSIDWTANHFFSGTENGLFSIFSSKSGTQQLYAQRFQSSIRDVGLSRWNSQSLLIAEESGMIHLFDWNSSNLSLNSSISFRPEHDAPLTSAKLFPVSSQLPSSSSLLLSSGLDNKVFVYDFNRKNAVHQFRADAPILCMDIHHEGNFILLGGIDGSISIMDFRHTAKPFHYLKKAHSVGPVRAVKFTGLRPNKSTTNVNANANAPPALSSSSPADSPKSTRPTSSLTSRASATSSRYSQHASGPRTLSALKDGMRREPFNFSTATSSSNNENNNTAVAANSHPSQSAAVPVSPVQADGQDNLLEISFISPILPAENRVAARTASSLRGSSLFSAAGINDTATKPLQRNGHTNAMTAVTNSVSDGLTNGIAHNTAPNASASAILNSALLKASLPTSLPVQPNRSVTAVLANLLGQSAAPAASASTSAATVLAAPALGPNATSTSPSISKSATATVLAPFPAPVLATHSMTASHANSTEGLTAAGSDVHTTPTPTALAGLPVASMPSMSQTGGSSAVQSLQSRFPHLSEEQLTALRSFISAEVSASTESMRECVIQLQLDMLRSFHELQLTVQSSLQTHQQAMEEMLKEIKALRDDYLQIRHTY